MDNKGWVDRVRSGKYRKWMEKNYKSRWNWIKQYS